MNNVGGRIEIPMEEYNTLKEKINALEIKLNDFSKKEIEYKQKLDECQNIILDLKGESLFNRIFKWNKIIHPLISLFKNGIEQTK